ncbi:MAG: AMP-binding protein, partial [bacterium]|nr:AMP-binding protein [bacterium]
TGNPKGVMAEHRGLANYANWAAGQYFDGENLKVPLYTSYSFDMTVTTIFTPLITGNTIVIYGGDETVFLISKIIYDNQVDVIKATPSHLKLIRAKEMPGKPDAPSKLKRFIVGGEELETKLAKEIYDNFNGAVEIYNEYGPTETVVGSMIFKFDPHETEAKGVSIGNPIANTAIYLLDRNLEPVPVGAIGEIYIAGAGVARGYLEKPDLTTENFLQNPFKSGQRLYRTGDLARWQPGEQAKMEYLGRGDQQVNIRGFRVELGEIENQLLEHDQIDEAVVIVAAGTEESSTLCAYIVTKKELKPLELRQYLSTNLAPYMIPAFFIPLERLPLSPSGKLERKKLPKPGANANTGDEYVPPGSDIEKKLVVLWEKELGIENIGITNGFFNVGGDSIKSISLLNLVNKEFNTDLKIIDLYQNETIKKLAEKITSYEKNENTGKMKDILEGMDDLKSEFLEGV